MNSQNFLLKTLLTLLSFLHSSKASGLFREYIGAEFKNVKLSDVPINPNVNFHFILSFAVDYTTSTNNPSPTNGNFNIFWDTNNLTPLSVSEIKRKNKNVKVALSLGGNSVANVDAVFQPLSVNSWVDNAVSSLTRTIKQYNLDGIDIDYEHFKADSETFSECIGQLVTRLKRNGVISFASIAPFDDELVKSHYLVLWKKYKSAIDYVNFQFYAYGAGTTMGQFLEHFERQRADFDGGKVIVSFATDKTSGGLRPGAGFFRACDEIKRRGELIGIFVWSADDSASDGFRLEKEAQSFLANM